MRMESVVWMLIGFSVSLLFIGTVWTSQVEEYTVGDNASIIFQNYTLLATEQSREIENMTEIAKGDLVTTDTTGETGYTPSSKTAWDRVWDAPNMIKNVLYLAASSTDNNPGINPIFIAGFLGFIGFTFVFGLIYFLRGIRSW